MNDKGRARLEQKYALILEFIDAFKAEFDGCAPTYTEIGEAAGIPSNSEVRRYLRALELAGEVRVIWGKSRMIMRQGNK